MYIRAAYEGWRTKFPRGYELFEGYARQALEKGYTQFSARTIVERMRWELTFGRVGGEAFKINDHYTPYLARELMSQYPEFEGFFKVRQLTHIRGITLASGL